MFNSTMTCYARKFINHMKCGLKYTPLLNTTLNEKFNILPTSDDLTIPYPSINMLVIGNGLRGDLIRNSRLDLKSSVHNVTDASLVNHMPFYLRKTTELDLYPPSDKLCLKTNMSIGDTEYTAYFGYRITEFENNDDITYFKNNDTDFVNISKLNVSSMDVLNPIIKNNVSTGVINSEYIIDFIKAYTMFSSGDIKEVVNAYSILEPGITPYITEMAVCFSKDSVTKKEVLQTQIAYFLDVYEPLTNIDKDFIEFFIELGDSEVVIK